MTFFIGVVVGFVIGDIWFTRNAEERVMPYMRYSFPSLSPDIKSIRETRGTNGRR